MNRRRWATAGLILLVIVLTCGAAAGGYALTHAARHRSLAATARSTHPTPSALAAAASAPTPAANTPLGQVAAPAAVRRALASAVLGSATSGPIRGEVLDADTGSVLFDDGGSTPAAPASTAKLLTATALFAVRAPTDRLRTTIVAASGGAVALVGGGDPTLTGAAVGVLGPYPGAARLSDLAAQLRRSGGTPTRILVDDSLFTGPTISPAWAAGDVPSSYGSAITPLLSDGGRPAPNASIRSAAPDLAAGHELAALLGRPDLPVSRGSAPPSARLLASVESAPMATLVEQMLQQSDNVIAECLARQVAIAEHRPATFLGAAAAISDVLRGLGVDPGSAMVDGSGLAAGDRVTPAALARLVALDAGSTRPVLHQVLDSLPVAGWSGSLAGRFTSGSARAGAGVVRAKTGTLTGVSALAGTVHDQSGRLLTFAFVASAARSTAGAEAALDTVAGRLAQCGCG